MQWFAHLHYREPGEASAPKTRGVVITSAWRYDFLMRLEAPAQSREVDDDHPSRHDRRPFVPCG